MLQNKGRSWNWRSIGRYLRVFFYGAAQNNACGGGALLFLSVTHFFELTVGLGEGTNNYAELLSLKLLLIFAAKKGCQNINIYGDSMNVINWTRGI